MRSEGKRREAHLEESRAGRESSRAEPARGLSQVMGGRGERERVAMGEGTKRAGSWPTWQGYTEVRS